MMSGKNAIKKEPNERVLAAAGVLGFEPRQRDPESRVLPLDDTPMGTFVVYAIALVLSSFEVHTNCEFLIGLPPIICPMLAACATVANLL